MTDPGAERLALAVTFLTTLAPIAAQFSAALSAAISGRPRPPAIELTVGAIGLAAVFAVAGLRPSGASRATAAAASVLAAFLLRSALATAAIPLVASAACGLAVNRLANRLPTVLDGEARKRPAVSFLWLVLAGVAIVQTARASVFMADPTLGAASVRPESAYLMRHSSAGAIVIAALSRDGVTNLWDPALFPVDPAEWRPRSKPIDTHGFRVDRTNYAPTHLLPFRALLLISDDYLLLRTIWFGIEATFFGFILVALAAWVGGKPGANAMLLAPIVWIATPTRLTLQFGHFYPAALALSLVAMLAFEAKRFAFGGVSLAYAAIVRLSPGFLLIYLFAARRRRELVWFTAGTIALIFLTVAILGSEPVRVFATEQLPRIARSEGMPPLGGSRNRIADNLSPTGFVLKLSSLGIVTFPMAAISFVQWIYVACAAGLIFLSARRPPASRAGRAAQWLAVLNLAALATASAPATYLGIGFVWQATLVAAEAEKRLVSLALPAAVIATFFTLPVVVDGRRDYVVPFAAQVVGFTMAVATMLPPRATRSWLGGLRLVPILLLLGAASAGAQLKSGDVLGPENWQQAEGLLPPEFLDLYRRGDFRHRIVDWHLEPIGEDPVFKAAIEENSGRYDLTDVGAIIDVRTGKPPEYVYGWPFPRIDPADPKAAMKIVWNYYYTLYYGGNGHYRADLLWLSRSGLDRAIEVDSRFKHYDGQHPRFREEENPDRLLTQSLADVRSPADVAGILSLSWRYRDPGQRDSVWVFVPAMRRVRQVSPANRSDGFLGSDMTQDDGAYFDGKIEDFTWRLVGEQDFLTLFDRLSLEEPAQLQRLPGDGWRMRIPGGARLGFQQPDWKGVSWCPTQEVLIRRPHWIVEAVPKDKYYLFGKVVLRFDKDIFLGSYSSKYDWQGRLISSFSGIRTNVIKVSPGEFWGWAGGAVAVAINWKLDRATTAGIVVGDGVPADSRIPLSPQVFSLQNLMAKGR